MWLYYSAIGMVIVANVFYHIFQKSTPADANPLTSLAVTYVTAAVVCLLLLPFFPGNTGIIDSFKKTNWVSFGLGIAIVGLELGFLLAYRAGWNINLAGLFANIAVGLILIPVGLLLFNEKLTVVNIAGIVLCLGGLAMINTK